jgi:hypothetical protein
MGAVSYSFFLEPEFDELMIQNRELVKEMLVLGVTRSWEPSIHERAGLCLVIMGKFDPKSFHQLSAVPKKTEEIVRLFPGTGTGH